MEMCLNWTPKTLECLKNTCRNLDTFPCKEENEIIALIFKTLMSRHEKHEHQQQQIISLC